MSELLSNNSALGPLETLQLSPELDGRYGTNRAPGLNVLGAEHDLQAIETWLAEFAHSALTQRHYRKEAERLLLWALVERGKALSDLNREDLQLYQRFLANPQPASRWCGVRRARSDPRWRPFQGPLSASSQRTALLIIRALFNYLVQAQYWKHNPLALQRRRLPQATAQVERYLNLEQWRALRQAANALDDSRHRVRARYLLALLYLLGPRISEVAQHTMGSFVQRRGLWWWEVVGKGQKAAQVPVNQDMLEALGEYRRFYQLPELPVPNDPTPLVLSLNGQRGIGANMLHRIIKGLAEAAAHWISDAWQAQQLRLVSAHWLRHTSITQQAYAGISLQHLQRNARHSRIDTTSLYLHGEEARWHAEMEQHRLPEED